MLLPLPGADPSLDGTFKAFAISLPESSELIDRIPEADPLLLYQVGCIACAAGLVLHVLLTLLPSIHPTDKMHQLQYSEQNSLAGPGGTILCEGCMLLPWPVLMPLDLGPLALALRGKPQLCGRILKSQVAISSAGARLCDATAGAAAAAGARGSRAGKRLW